MEINSPSRVLARADLESLRRKMMKCFKWKNEKLWSEEEDGSFGQHERERKIG